MESEFAETKWEGETDVVADSSTKMSTQYAISRQEKVNSMLEINGKGIQTTNIINTFVRPRLKQCV